VFVAFVDDGAVQQVPSQREMEVCGGVVMELERLQGREGVLRYEYVGGFDVRRYGWLDEFLREVEGVGEAGFDGGGVGVGVGGVGNGHFAAGNVDDGCH
jgi:hypothetical protein